MKFFATLAIAAAVRLQAETEKLPKEVIEKAVEAFNACDTNDDKIVTKKEFKACAKKNGLTGNDLRNALALFRKAAGDKKLTKKELKAALRQAYKAYKAKSQSAVELEEDAPFTVQEAFDLCDYNKNGFLTESEGKKCAKEYGIKDPARSYIGNLMADHAGDDGKVDINEFKAALEQAKKDAPKAEQVIKACDKNGDEKVSMKEAKACAKKQGITGKSLKGAMKLLRKVAGKDKKISLDELKEAYKAIGAWDIQLIYVS